MTKSLSQLQLVRGIAQSREQKLAGEVGELMRQRAAATATLARLQEYLREYQGEENVRGARPLTEIENERRFVKRLHAALQQQTAQARRLSESASLKMQLWQREHANLQALDRLLMQRTQQQSRVADRREQQASDAMSLRAFNQEGSR